MNTIKISVRNLVEFILRSGDLTTSSGLKDPDAMQEGARIHKKILLKSTGHRHSVTVIYGHQPISLTALEYR